MTTPTPDAPVTLPNGIVADPAIHCFRDGKPILKTDGTPKLKPGRKPGTVVAKADSAPAPESAPAQALAPAPVEVVPTVTNVIAPVATKQAEPEKKAAHLAPMTAVVTRTFGKIGLPESKEEPLEVRTFITPPAHIELGYGLTLNIGNYESARVDVKLNVPCYREEVDEAYEWARKWAEDRVRREVKEVRAMAAPPKSNPF